MFRDSTEPVVVFVKTKRAPRFYRSTSDGENRIKQIHHLELITRKVSNLRIPWEIKGARGVRQVA